MIDFDEKAGIAILALLLLPLSTHAQADEPGSVESPTKPSINGTLEYASPCRICPYNLCITKTAPWYDDIYELTCWTK